MKARGAAGGEPAVGAACAPDAPVRNATGSRATFPTSCTVAARPRAARASLGSGPLALLTLTLTLTLALTLCCPRLAAAESQTLSAGTAHTCGIDANNRLHCWAGPDTTRQLASHLIFTSTSRNSLTR